MTLTILCVGPISGTSLHRAEAFERLGHKVRLVDAGPPRGFWRAQLYRVGHHLSRPPDLTGARRGLLAALAAEPVDLVWVEKGVTLGPRALRAARRIAPHSRFVSYSPDDMTQRAWNSVPYLRAVPLYDAHITTKTHIMEEMGRLGAREVLFVDNAYDPVAHRPMELSPADRARFGCEVGFIGFYETERARALVAVARAGMQVRIHGPAWHRLRDRPAGLSLGEPYLEGVDYARAIGATRINLGFLRKQARDLQTTRSIEIPACGGFMLGERTGEHRRLFREGVEAEYFDSVDELVAKCRHYLAHEAERAAIAAAGRRRCVEGGYSNDERLRDVLARLGMADTVLPSPATPTASPPRSGSG